MDARRSFWLIPALVILVSGVSPAEEGGDAAKKVAGPVEDGESPAQDFGNIWVYKKSRKIITTGSVCLEKGPLEYLACFRKGKDHESVVAADCKPENLNLAFIVLNYKSGGGVKQLGDPEAPSGDPFFVYVEWTVDGKTKRIRAEELLHNLRTKKHMKHTAWVYTGSEFFTDKRTGKEVFGASVTGVLAAVYRDPYAIFNSPLDTGADDIYYEVNQKTSLKRGTKVKIIFAPATKKDIEYEDGAEDAPQPDPKPGGGDKAVGKAGAGDDK